MAIITEKMFPEFKNFTLGNLEIVQEALEVAKSNSNTDMVDLLESFEQSLRMNSFFLNQMDKHPVAAKMLLRK